MQKTVRLHENGIEMSWLPKEYFLSPQEFFGALVPGAIGTTGLFFVLRDSTIVAPFFQITQPAQWLAFAICSLVLGLVAYPLGVPLDKLYNSLYARPRRRGGDPLFEFATRRAELDRPGISSSKTESIYDWARIHVEAKDPLVNDERGRLQGISKMFRSLSLMFLVGTVVLFIQAAVLWAVLSAVAFLISFLRFCQFRWQATTLIYQRFKSITEDTDASSRIVIP